MISHPIALPATKPPPDATGQAVARLRTADLVAEMARRGTLLGLLDSMRGMELAANGGRPGPVHPTSEEYLAAVAAYRALK